ncbi:MAG: prolipoprotein diacylglyceryl transferase [Anaerolineales bacterium]
MLPILQLGPLSIPTAEFTLLLGLWLGLNLAEKHAPQHGLNASAFSNLALIALLGGIVSARLGFAIQNAPAFSNRPLDLLSLNPGLLDLWSGIVGGGLLAIIYAQRKGFALLLTLDSLVPLLAVLGVAIPLANLASGKGFGAAANLPWSIQLWGAARHPTQVYELIAAALILWWLYPENTRRPEKPAGLAFWSFLALSAGARLFLEAFRGDSFLLSGGVRAVQIGAWLLLAASLWMLYRLQPQTNPKTEQ